MSQGSQALMLMDTSATFSVASEPYAFLTESLKQSVELNIDESIRGTRSRSKERTGVASKKVGGSISMRPSPAELDKLLPRILGAAESFDSFALAESLPEFWVYVQRDIEKYMYHNCKVGSATFSGSEGQAVQLAMEIFGKTRTKAGTFPAVALDTDNFYSFHQGVLTVNSVTHNFKTFEVKIDNLMEVLFENSVTATSVEATDRIITLSCDLPYNAAANTLQDAIDNGEKVSGSLVFTNGGQSLTFTFPALINTDEDPVIGGRGKIRYPITLQALQSGTSKELVVTHDSVA